MRKKFLGISVLFSISMMALAACNLPTSPTETQTPAPVPVTGITPPQPTEIQHRAVPVNLPDRRTNHAGDYDSSTTASGKRSAGGDRFTYEQFERPFNANTMDVYFPNLDIRDTMSYQDDTWIYGTILLKNLENNASTGKYGIQLDMDLDGKGDWLVIAPKPNSSGWGTDGVQVFQDANHDVGAAKAMFSDEHATSDGFETKVFDQGQGNDPDAAWVRIAPDNPHMVQIALKRALVGKGNTYLINMWAGTSMMDPALFDFSDHFTHEQAGAADPGFEIYYPIKAVAGLDNSCRMAVGFAPKGNEPGLCKELIIQPEEPDVPPPPEPEVPLDLGPFPLHP